MTPEGFIWFNVGLWIASMIVVWIHIYEEEP